MNKLVDRLVFWGLCAILIFVPLPIGSVEEWAVFAFEAATIGLFLLYVGSRLVGRVAGGRRPGWSRAAGPDGGATEIFPGRPVPEDLEGRGRLPGFVKALLGVFLAVSVLQIIPLPEGVVGLLSPRAHAIYAGLVREAILAPASSLTLSLAPGATVYELVLIVCYGLFGYLVLRTVRGRGRAEALIVVILASAVFQACYGMAETFSGHETILGRAKRYGLGSVTGTFVNRNHFAGFLEMAFPLSLGYLLVKARYFAMEKGLSLRRKVLWFGQESLQWTILLGLVPVFIGVGLVFSKSRSGILVMAVTAVLAGVAAMSWREFSSEGEGGRAGAGAGAGAGARIVRLVAMVILAAAVWLGLGPVISRFAEIDVSAENRATFYRNTVEMIGDFPWTGTGKGTYVNAYAMYEKLDDRLRLSFAHNDYLEFAAENGVVGGGAVIAAGIGLAVWLAALWRRRRGAFAKGAGLGCLLGVTAILLHGFTDFNLQITANAVYFVTLAVLGAIVLAGTDKKMGTPARGAAAGTAGKGTVTSNCPPSEVRKEMASFRRRRKGSTYLLVSPLWSRLRWLVVGLVALAAFAPALRDDLGYHYLDAYRRTRSEARSIESAYPRLAAILAKATTVSSRAVFQAETARLNMEMAKVANDAGREEERDTFCDKAVVAYGKAIAANPIDAAILYETGTAYLLYNFPLMTYQDRAKAFFRAALAAKPADAAINLNVLFLYFAWWPTLEDADRSYAAVTYRAMIAREPGSAAELEGRWTRTFGSPDGLRAILSDLPR